MKVAIGTDHRGYALKETVIAVLEELGHEVMDKGACSYDKTDDYVDFAVAVGQAIQAGEAERGVLICGSGVGVTIAANKLRGVRACLCHDHYSAHQGVEHDDMNVLCLGARIIGIEIAKELVRTFVEARFSSDERHRRRLVKVIALE